MANVKPMSREELPALESVLAGSEAMMGFVPNSMLTMGHMPQLAMAFSLLAGTVFGADLKMRLPDMGDQVPDDANADQALPPALVQLIAFSGSVVSGCRYCQAHTSHNAHRFGITEEKLAAILQYEESELFDEAERAVVAIAMAAAEVPNATEERHFAALRLHFTERQIVQIVAVIALFGFLNRWNDTMATELEGVPRQFAGETLGDAGWQVGKHAG